jgi:small subunit ribosomal protein S7
MINKNNKNLYDKFLGFLVKKGNKISAKHLLNEAFFKVSKKTGLSLSRILLKLFLKLNSFVEVKRIRVRRSSHLVPFSIRLKRRYYLTIKWLLQAVKEDTRKVPMSEKLFLEIANTIKKVPSRSVKLRNLNISQALANRSNIHYRW